MKWIATHIQMSCPTSNQKQQINASFNNGVFIDMKDELREIFFLEKKKINFNWIECKKNTLP